MHQIKYKARVQFQAFDGTASIRDFEFFARDKENARQIAKEIFLIEEPQARNIQIGVKFVKPTEQEVGHINKVLANTYEQLKSTFERKDYTEFVRGYTAFNGWNFIKHYDNAEYLFKFCGLTCKAIWANNHCTLDDEEIIYYSDTFNREYVIQDNGITILIGS